MDEAEHVAVEVIAEVAVAPDKNQHHQCASNEAADESSDCQTLTGVRRIIVALLDRNGPKDDRQDPRDEQHAEDDADDAEYQRRDGEPVGPLTSAG